MSDELYIWVNRWDEFQTFQKKRGKPWTPPWIKLYPDLLDNPDYLSLTPRQRSILVGIWLLFARTRLKLGSSPAQLGRMLGDDSVRARDLAALNHAGFISFCSRTVLEQKRNAFWNGSSPEPEVEVEKEEPVPEPMSTTPRATDNGKLDYQTELELAELLGWIGDDADAKTPNVIRSCWTKAPEAARIAVRASMRNAKAQNRAAWLVSAIKGETERARSTS